MTHGIQKFPITPSPVKYANTTIFKGTKSSLRVVDENEVEKPTLFVAAHELYRRPKQNKKEKEVSCCRWLTFHRRSTPLLLSADTKLPLATSPGSHRIALTPYSVRHQNGRQYLFVVDQKREFLLHFQRRKVQNVLRVRGSHTFHRYLFYKLLIYALCLSLRYAI